MHGITLFEGKNIWPTVGIMAVTHGDEPAWISAHNFLKDFLQKNPLTSWKLVLIEGNPEAAKDGLICVEENLNRIFKDDSELTLSQKKSKEYKRSRELMKVLWTLDYLLDIHSTSSPSTVFSIIKTDTPEHRELASYLPVDFSSSGWSSHIMGMVCDYADSQWCISVIIECGTHTNPQWWEVATLAAKMFLQKIWLIDFGITLKKSQKHLSITGLEHIRDAKTFHYSRAYHNFDSLLENELIAKDQKHLYYAPNNHESVIIFPTKIEHIRNGHCKEAYLLGIYQ